MTAVAFLIIAPLVAALALVVVRQDKARSVVVVVATLALAVTAVYLAATSITTPIQSFNLDAEPLTYLVLAIDLACSAYVIARGVRLKNHLAVFLAGIQAVLVTLFELAVAHHVATATDLYLDQLSIIMVLIIALIGGGICLYSLGYMRDFQAHLDHTAHKSSQGGDPARLAEARHRGRDRRGVFFALMFVFMSAMYAIVFSNNLGWLLCGWEVTTVCSFALISYTRTPEALTNAFRAVNINLAGGLAFCLALILLGSSETPILELDKLIFEGADGMFMFPIALLVFACFTKSAQMPFQSWLLGAMVAPTPTSALLHSSTMVKAGVFLLIKLSPTFGWDVNGMMVIFVGALSFLYCSAVAITQHNAKRVLAYSTIANLGLIVCCAGIGSPEAVWAAIFLLIFHAAAKALLFCCVGTAEHHLRSRDIEDMDNLFVRMPLLATLMALGMMAMFIAPFGMLISKWAALVSMITSGHLELLLVLAFGSALTFMFWAKWLGKILAMAQGQSNREKTIHLSERVGLGLMATLLILATVALPLLSSDVVVPYLQQVASTLPLAQSNGPWGTVSTALGFDNLLLMVIVLVALLAVFAARLPSRRQPGNDSVYLSGVGLDSSHRSFSDALGHPRLASQRNWYLKSLFGEKLWERKGNVFVGLILVVGILATFVLEAGGL
ncbi:MAG: hypothetical protein LBU07_06470 [Coriobacteriales bacterium]|jgi:ech hydrogenase subunit A|nr:hypothetical protein [Coriobacteriales bacterium]